MKLHTAFLTFLLLNFLFGCTAILKNESGTVLPGKSGSDVKIIKAVADSEGQDDILIEDDEDNNDLADTDKANIEILPELNDALEFCDISQKFWEKGEPDKALNALDHAYSLLLKADTEESPALTQQKEDLRFTISKRILEIYASRNTSIKGRHNEIPVILNTYINEEIEYLSKGDFFKNAFKRAGKYRPAILEKLKKAGLPSELSWLPLIESGFTTNALSSARALGLWQFIPSTGYKFGLSRDLYIDERLDPDKSTTAAVAYLKELHRIFGDWATVLAAYNCGEGRVLKTIRSQNVNYLDNFWDLYEKLPRETARYVPRFLATLHMVNHPEKYGLNTVKTDSPLEYETLIVKKQISLKDIAKAIDVDPAALKELNPELRKRIVPDDSYSLRIPPGKKEILLSKLDTIPTVSQPEPKNTSQINYAYYRVKKGDSLANIAKRYNTSVKTILNSNRMHKRNYIVAGNILKIPHNGKSIYAETKKTKGRYISTHIVRNGDSLWNIAQKYGTTTKIIHKLNKLPNNKLSIGQVLKIPGVTTISSKKYSRTYKVKNGDVPVEIAKRHNMSLERLLKVNRLNQHSKIFPGQQLHVE